MSQQEVVNLAKYMDQKIRVKFQGGREVEGILKGFDKLDNLVIADCVEYLRDPRDLSVVTENTRALGLVVCKGTQICLLMPSVGMQEIPNPFEEEDESINVVGGGGSDGI